MKLLINTRSFAIEEVKSFDGLTGLTCNGQHRQLSGYVLAEVMEGRRTQFALYHPETGPATGHVDVIVDYNGTITFQRYSGFEEINPRELDGDLKSLWPSGAWHLMQVVLAIEEYLERRTGFTPALRNRFLDTLQALVPA